METGIVDPVPVMPCSQGKIQPGSKIINTRKYRSEFPVIPETNNRFPVHLSHKSKTQLVALEGRICLQVKTELVAEPVAHSQAEMSVCVVKLRCRRVYSPKSYKHLFTAVCAAFYFKTCIRGVSYITAVCPQFKIITFPARQYIGSDAYIPKIIEYPESRTRYIKPAEIIGVIEIL